MDDRGTGQTAAPEPGYDVEIEHDVRIPVRDGLRLSANLFRPVAPDDAHHERFPAILEMIPYRKDDWRYATDVGRGTYLAQRGYVLCRVDIRGTGSSPGIALDEYTEAETLDGCDVVEWLAGQPWCNGNVGMWGISYGGFTAIQVAARRPPHLKAIAPMYATDDRYTDDVHYIGGCATVSELAQYAVSQVAMNALPPRPSYAGPGWIDEWRRRLEETPVWLFEWARRQRDGDYWRQGSLAPDYERITAAILHIGGWMDSYVDPVLRMQARCSNAPRRSIIGNWVHSWPDAAYPGPTTDWLALTVRFFDHWLKGIENGVMDEPALVYFRREYTPPEPFPATLNGSWQAEPAYPVERVRPFEMHLAATDLPCVGRLTLEATGSPAVERFEHRPTIGTRGSLSWGSGHPPNGLARDLRIDEALVPTYTSAPLTEPLDVLGIPEAILHLASSARVAHVVVRLADVAPDGASHQVSAGILNLTHRESHVEPSPLEPGHVYEVRIPLRSTGYRFLPGQRIRLSIASAYWPVIWPSPEPSANELHVGGEHPSRLVLPVVAGSSAVAAPAYAAKGPALLEIGSGSSEAPAWRITEDVMDGSLTVTTYEADTSELPDGTTLATSEALEMTAWEGDPGRATFDNRCVYALRQDGIAADVEAVGRTVAGGDAFTLDLALSVRLDGAPFFERSWHEVVPRDLV